MGSPLRWTVLSNNGPVVVSLLIGGIANCGCHSSPSDVPSSQAGPSSPEPARPAAAPMPPMLPVVPVTQASATQDELLDDIYAALQASSGDRLDDSVRKQIIAYRDSGFPVAAGLKALYEREGTVQERTILLAALHELGGPEGLTTLKELALKPGNSGATLGPRAVKVIAEASRNPDDVAALLESDSAETRDSAAMALQGQQLTPKAVEQLGQLLKSKSWITHNLVATAFATDTSTTTANRKIELLLAALPNLNDLTPDPAVPLGESARDPAFNQYVSSLANMPGAETLLQQQFAAAQVNSPVYDALALASALRGNQAARSRVVELAESERNPSVRALAVQGLQVIGTSEELPLLQRIATSDPYFVTSHKLPRKQTYPIRRSAQNAIDKITTQQPK